MLLLVAFIAAILLVVLAIRYVTVMPSSSYAGPAPPLSAAENRLVQAVRRHVENLAGTIGERNVWRLSALETTVQYLTRELEAVGYEVGAQEYNVSSATVMNLDAELLGATRPREIVLIGAHYDTVRGCPGANDNGTGVAALLELARLLSEVEHQRTIRFVAFVNEEPPFCFTNKMGSRRYARRCREEREHIVAMLSLETIGCYSDNDGSQAYPFPFGLFYPKTGNFIAFVGNLSSGGLVRRCIGAFRRSTKFPSEGTAAPGYLPGIFWSDHWSFWRERYRALMVTDTAPFRYPHYHTAEDTPDKIDYERTARVVLGLRAVITDLAS